MHKHIISVRDYVKRFGIEGVLKSALSKHCSRWPREKDAIIKHLLDCEDIFAFVVGKGTRYWHQEYREAFDAACRQPKTS